MIVAFHGSQPIGLTFMDWSFHYLSGVDRVWHWIEGWQPLTNDPSSGGNAHGHDKNHPEGLDEIKKFVNQVKKSRLQETISLYPFIDGPKVLEQTFDIQRQMLEFLNREKIKIVSINSSRIYPFFRERTETPPEQLIAEISRWIGIETDDIRIIRDKLSLYMIGLKERWLEKTIEFQNQTNDLFSIHFKDIEWIHHTEDCLHQMFDRLGMTMDQTRLSHWRNVRNKWVKQIINMEKWYQVDVPMIVNAIVENKNLDLAPHEKKLDLLGQATIMAFTMRDHGRRIILNNDDFPKNTQDLYKFLK